jgi:hypothetical protein
MMQLLLAVPLFTREITSKYLDEGNQLCQHSGLCFLRCLVLVVCR